MKRILATSILLATNLAHGAAAFPGGLYCGSGDWKTSGTTEGSYEVCTTITDEKICSGYSWDGGSDTFCFDYAMDSRGFLTIENGWGYCYDYQCHYQISAEGIVVEETFSFVDDNLYKVGSKQPSGQPRTVWQEALQSR